MNRTIAYANVLHSLTRFKHDRYLSSYHETSVGVYINLAKVHFFIDNKNMNKSKHITYEEAISLERWWLYDFDICEDTYKGSALYVLEFDNGIKFGISRNLNSRLQQYKSPWCREIKRTRYYKTANPAIIEGLLKEHYTLLTEKGSSEFVFNVSFEEITKLIESKQGFKKFVKKMHYDKKRKKHRKRAPKFKKQTVKVDSYVDPVEFYSSPVKSTPDAQVIKKPYKCPWTDQ